MNLSEEQLDSIIDRALAEDISRGDITSEALLPPGLQGKAVIRVKAKGVLAGGEVARRVLLRVDPSLKIEIIIKDGARVKPGDMLATISGTVMSILKAERVALNFLQRLSGIATETARFVARAQGLPVTILDTRKTTPGLRLLEKYAVRTGGGQNHRLDLSDGILIKDTHLAALHALGMDLPGIITRAKRNAPHHLKVEIEVSTVEEAVEAAAAGADIIMLDNMSPEEMRRAASLTPAGVKLEASGGITLKNIGAAARSGVDFISIGALTHSPRALDMSLTIQ
ncbi:MAG TPA: carboxylating nicotinate-nucleotide diphosphorylase [Dehalococcoidia bacterium]|nr:carboxylating nicotinate-nucleotide diphosphorylase [Dehalococcoidia bacterium]